MTTRCGVHHEEAVEEAVEEDNEKEHGDEDRKAIEGIPRISLSWWPRYDAMSARI